MNGFLVLWPKCHGVVSIGTSKCMDGLNVMDEGVILGYVEIIMNFEPDHDVLVTIKGV